MGSFTRWPPLRWSLSIPTGTQALGTGPPYCLPLPAAWPPLHVLGGHKATQSLLWVCSGPEAHEPWQAGLCRWPDMRSPPHHSALPHHALAGSPTPSDYSPWHPARGPLLTPQSTPTTH